MRFKEVVTVFESPQLIPPVDFNLERNKNNRVLAAKLLKKNKETIEEDGNTIFFRTGDGVNGYYVLYNKHDEVIAYLIKYKSIHNRLISSKAVTQIILWRLLGDPYVSGITKHVFFDILVPRYGAILSDSHQTERGKEFWIQRLADASTGPYEIGLVDFKFQKVNWWNKVQPFHEWLEESNGWGVTSGFVNLRYIIKAI